ncbi:MAG: MBL fold metallo-hydrolase [Brooklawnia sp.]|uniref:MBL fold metallo-hydrolase n=1 Tax=Brooklawnia sp. TaxID=2699740 RepID=UPI003C7479A5
MFIVPFVCGPWQANCYVVAAAEPAAGHRQPALVIDPGVQSRPQVDAVTSRHHLDLAGVVCTHGHVDHVADAAKLANDHRVPLWLHPADLPMLTRPALGLGHGSELLIQQVLGSTRLPAPNDLRELADDQQLDLAGIQLRVRHAPGHTPGCVVLTGVADGVPVMFSGDVLFAGSIGRVDLPGGSMAQMRSTLGDLRDTVDPVTSILPGHGPATTMARELAGNPYLTKEMLA